MSYYDELSRHYERSLAEKTKKLHQILPAIGYSADKVKIRPSPFQEFRLRGKFKVYTSGKVMGTDPVKGEVPYTQALWIFPSFICQAVRRTVSLIILHRREWPVDGFEIKGAHQNKEVFLILAVKKSRRGKSYDAFAQLLLKEVPCLAGVAIPSQKRVYGAEYISHFVLGERLLSHYQAFFQVNPHLLSCFLSQIKREVRTLNFQEAYDLYCGVGLFSQLCLPPEKRIIGIDLNSYAINSARLNALNLSRATAYFFSQRAEEFLASCSPRPDSLWIINPSRQGCESKVIKQLLELTPSWILFVSCSLVTLKKNVFSLVKNGYKIMSLDAYDQFPFSPFLETVTLMRRGEAKSAA